MNGKVQSDQELVRRVRELPRSIPLGRDLWPGIEARILGGDVRAGEAAGGNVRWPLVWVASIVLFFAVGLMTGRQLGNGPDSGELLPRRAPGLLAATVASEREYQAAFRQFMMVGEAHPVFEGQAVQNIENSWLEMRQTETSLLAALQDYPENRFLNEKLLDLRAQQLGFMRQIAMLDQFSRRKI